MFRKFVLCALLLVHGFLIFPNLFAWERDEQSENAFLVHEYIIRAALVDLKWLVLPTEWRDGLTITPEQPELSPVENQETVTAVDLPLPQFRYANLVLPLSEKYGMDWKLVAAVMAIESNYNPRAISPKGAIGLMQLMPTTAALYQVSSKELFNPKKNIEAGVLHLKMLHDRYDGDLSRVIAAYNSGEGAVDRYNGVPPYRFTRAFVRRVMARYQTHVQNELQATSAIYANAKTDFKEFSASVASVR
ncbi:lytic transglycosylase domain-containing protein [bacterium]|nr:lytic transglycosylase domain-containing protein [bacterium]